MGLRTCLSRHKVPPRDNADNRQIDREIDHRDQDGADENRPWDHPAGILYLVTDIADVVVAQVVVDADPRRGAEAQQEAQGEGEGARGKSDATRWSKCSAPVTTTTLAVMIVPIQSVTVIAAIDVIRRYRSARLASPTMVTTSIVWRAVMPFQM